MTETESMQCERCFGEVHPDARACRHCGASFEDEGWLTPVQWAVLAWVAAIVSFVTGWTLIEIGNANGESNMLGGVLFLVAFPLTIVAVYYTIRAAARS